MISLFAMAGGFHKLKDTNRIVELVGRGLRPLVFSAWAARKSNKMIYSLQIFDKQKYLN
jgi:hypothetical protein